MTLTPAQKRIHEAALRLFSEKGSSEVSISELAAEAGIARGTIYNNVEAPERLFESVAAQLTEEMVQRIGQSYGHIADPAQRVATGIRMFIRRSHAEPQWGRFVVHFAYHCESLRSVLMGLPMEDVMRGISEGQFHLRPEQVPSAVGLISGSVLSAMLLVLEGHRTWRDAGQDTAELVLRAMGLTPAKARKIAAAELPALAEADR